MSVDLALLLAAVAAALGVLQWVLARWRDLGPWTVAAVGCAAVLLEGQPSPVQAGLLLTAAACAAGGWTRGMYRGVGRPGLCGVTAAAAVLAWIGAVLLPESLPLDPTGTRQVAAVALAVVGGVCGLVALERKRGGGPPPRWVGEIPIH